MKRILTLISALALPAALLAQASPSSDGAAPPAAGVSSSPAAPSASAPPSGSAGGDHVPNRTVSSGVAAMLAAGMPSYDPPKPPPPQPPDDQQTDLRDVDKPRNHIIRLPKYVVHAQKPPIFREQDLYTADGLARLAMMRYAGLNLGPSSSLNAPIAAEMYREDQRLNNMADLKDTADAMKRGGDAAESSFINNASAQTYQQSLDWGTPGVPENPSARTIPGQP